MNAARVAPWLEALLIGAIVLGLFHAAAALANPDLAWRPQWDEGHYATITAYGYAFDGSNHLRASGVAFSPGYPSLLRAVHWLTGMHIHPARLVLSGTLFLLSAMLAHALFSTVFTGRREQRRALLTFLLAPGALFTMVGYAEAAYLPLTLGFFLALARQRRLLACACAALALSVRSPAVVLPLTLLVVTLLEALSHRTAGVGLRRLARLCCLELPICALGVCATIVVLHWQVGNGLAFLDAYVAWNKVEPAVASLVPMVQPTAILPYAVSHPSLWVALAGVYLTPLVVLAGRLHMPFTFVVYAGVSWLFFLWNENPCRLPYGNWIRWLAMLFPIAVGWVGLISGERAARWRVFEVGLVVQVAVFLWLAHRFAAGEWVS